MTDIVDDRTADAAGALDLVLTGAALSHFRRFQPGWETMRLVAELGRRPQKLAMQGTDLVREYGRIAMGASALAPSKGDRRFTDPAWNDNPLLHRVLQAYLATALAAETAVTDAHLDYRDDLRIRFLADNLIDAAAPSNNPLLSPLAWKSAIDTGGTSLLRGAASLVRDMATAPRIPTMVEPAAFEVGETLAVTPGAVVRRTAMYELIQYAPQTDRVRTVPLLIVPPVINKYYAIDLAPGRSLIEYLVAQGQQVFVVSWRNPDARHRSWGIDAYGQAILDGLDTARHIGHVEQAHFLALCSGGIIASMLAAHLAEIGRIDEVATLGLAVTVLDQSRAGLASALIDERVARMAVAASARRGYLDGKSLAEVFAWLRPNDLIWNYWVNNYLQGKQPPAFDVLYWNADTTRMAARLHRDFIDLAIDNALVTPGTATILGQPVDLSRVEINSYVVAGVADHLCPWQSCYETTQLLGGKSRFVLSNSGHIAALVNPPSNPKATFQTSEDDLPDADEWLKEARSESGSWWPDYAHWLAERSDWRSQCKEAPTVHWVRPSSPLSRPRRAPMSSTVEVTRVVNVLGQDLRVRIRPATGRAGGGNPGVALKEVAGSAARVRCAPTVRRRPGPLDRGGAFRRARRRRFAGRRRPVRLSRQRLPGPTDAPPSGVHADERARVVLGRGTGPANGLPVSPVRPQTGPRQQRHRFGHGARPGAGPGEDGGAAWMPVRRPARYAAVDRRRPLRCGSCPHRPR